METMETRRAVTFENREGAKLFGILHEPLAEGRRDVAIVLLSPGVKMRVAPHRLYNKMTARFVALGFTVFRFDFHGLGDSEGQVAEPLLADLYRAIQLGRYVEETAAAVEWVRKTTGIPAVVLAGLCGGAITGILTSAAHRHVAGVLGLGIPVILDGTAVDKVANMTGGQLRKVRSMAVAKLISPRAWGRLLTMRSDYRLLLRSLVGSRRAPSSGAPVPADARTPAPADNTNPLFPQAFERTLDRGCRVLLVFSGSDRLYWEFQEKYLQRHGRTLEKYEGQTDVEVVPDANHIFTFTHWQRDMLDRCDAWLRRSFPEPVAAAHRRVVALQAGSR